MNTVLAKQLALDYCCTPEEVMDNANHFAIYRPLEGRRVYQEEKNCIFKASVVHGKILIAGEKNIIEWCKERYSSDAGDWFFEFDNLKRIEAKLNENGYRIKMVHPFYISDVISSVPDRSADLQWYEQDEIQRFRGDKRWGEAFSFSESAPDVLGISASVDGNIVAMAGASRDSDSMWQIGINVEKEYRGKGIATVLVTALKNEVLRRGCLPFYGTAYSHLASQKVALSSGFVPAWAELATCKISKE